jgi:HK97 family phage prohead protease
MRVGNRTFREKVMPGAFDKCLRAGADIRGLINHDPNLILGRTIAGTMTVGSDGHGLRYEIDPPGTTYSDDLIKSMRRGDIDQSSFGFYTVQDDWKNTSDGLVRELIEADCFDVTRSRIRLMKVRVGRQRRCDHCSPMACPRVLKQT